jgi:hypothetical protein
VERYPCFRKALKYLAKVWFPAWGPSGSEKTYNFIKFTIELGGIVVLIDPKRGGSINYADKVEFNALSHDPVGQIKPVAFVNHRTWHQHLTSVQQHEEVVYELPM